MEKTYLKEFVILPICLKGNLHKVMTTIGSIAHKIFSVIRLNMFMNIQPVNRLYKSAIQPCTGCLCSVWGNTTEKNRNV